jgi:hypothetical protein
MTTSEAPEVVGRMIPIVGVPFPGVRLCVAVEETSIFHLKYVGESSGWGERTLHKGLIARDIAYVPLRAFCGVSLDRDPASY